MFSCTTQCASFMPASSVNLYTPEEPGDTNALTMTMTMEKMLLYSHLSQGQPKEMRDLPEQMTLLEWLYMMIQDLRHNLNDKLYQLCEILVVYFTFRSHYKDINRKKKIQIFS